MNIFIKQLVNHKKRASPFELSQIIGHVARVDFSPDLLEVDETLWGSFWHFDVLSPGYTLPALELALLRATRLDHHWPPDTSLQQFMLDLQETIQHPQVGIWSLSLAGQPCLIFAAPTGQHKATIVWYCASSDNLYAGYRTSIQALNLTQTCEQQSPGFDYHSRQTISDTPDWLISSVEQLNMTEYSNLTPSLDAEILRWRMSN